MPRFGWGLRRVRLDGGALINELVPVALDIEAKRKHRPTGRKRGRPGGAPGTKNADGWSDYRDWHIARVVKGGMAAGLGREISVGIAAMDVGVSVPTVERTLRRMRALRKPHGSPPPTLTGARRSLSPRLKNIPHESLDPPIDPEEILRLHRQYEES